MKIRVLTFICSTLVAFSAFANFDFDPKGELECAVSEWSRFSIDHKFLKFIILEGEAGDETRGLSAMLQFQGDLCRQTEESIQCDNLVDGLRKFSVTVDLTNPKPYEADNGEILHYDFDGTISGRIFSSRLSCKLEQ